MMNDFFEGVAFYSYRISRMYISIFFYLFLSYMKAGVMLE